ncbi:hypothetical protein L1987_75172 [Smallanthus sonchifolius]|uniref:Uncharacterized protein n=1 Tax=Smallanthus sonchifolius TaxID=185202 RepID=A0ACB9A475_9ASTR|nr:hypothetical protein L1987_75172 [Smallanthus sonchifolius]
MAAKPNTSVQEWKDELEKRVEVLTWFSSVEKRLRSELGNAKGQESAKLQDDLRMMQIQIDEANGKVIEELLKHHQLSRRRRLKA